MQRPQSETVTLNNILITQELSERSPRPPNLLSENQALHTLARQLVNQPETMLQSLVDISLDLCNAGTAGVSLLETTPNGEEVFRWTVLAGTLAQYVGGTTPRNFSPCGICLDRGTPQLFSHPDRYFTYFQAANTPIVEGLVLPLIADNHALGTIWIMSHDLSRHFDAEDVRVMTSLADFTVTALLLQQRQTGELLAANAALETEVLERKQAENRSRTLISNLPGGAVFVVDRDLRYLLAEGEALAIAGFKPEDLVGKTIFEVLSPELATSYDPMYRKALAGEPFEHEHQSHNRTYISRGTPLQAENGEIHAVLAISYDITDRKQAENALRESEERFRLFVSASSDIVYKMSADWREMYSLVGKNFLVSTEDSSQTWIETYIPPEEQPRVWAAIQEAIDTKSMFELEHRVIQQDGAIGWTFSRAIPMLNEQGDIVEWFGTASDVTDRKRTEAQLRRVAEMDAFRVKLADALRPIAEPLEVQRTASRILREHLGADRVAYAELDPDEDTARLLAEDRADDLASFTGVTYAWSDFDPVGHAEAKQGRSISRADVQAADDLTPAQKATFAAAGFRALINTPLLKSGRLVAFIAVHFERPHESMPADIALVEETAERTWAAVDRARAEAALRESELQRVREQAAREQERQRAESLAELDRAKTLFFTHVSHEFRTPLTLSLAPLSDALSDRTYPLAPPQRERLELAHRNAIRLLKLVNTLLDFSRIKAGRMEAVYEPTDLALFTTELASVFRSAIERAGLRLIVDCPPLPEPVYVDRQMWEKIVLNLLSNAFKFTFEGEISVSVRKGDREECQASTAKVDGFTSKPQVTSSDLGSLTSELGTSTSELGTSTSELGTSTSELGTLTSELGTSTSELGTSTSELETSTSELGTPLSTHHAATSQPETSLSLPHVILEVRDTGIGIPPEELPHVFERFYQVRRAKARTHEGSGIGLALVHELIRLHGGTVDVSSTLGQGTCFTITIPLGTAHLPSVSVSEAVATLGASAGRHSAHRLHRVVGDSPSETLRERITATRTLASTAVGAAPYVEEAECWLPEEGDKGEGGENSSLSSLSPLSSASPARVLLVDDNADMREYLTRILSEHVQVEAVADGASALAAAQQRVPDLILTDVMMPGLDGFELLKALRANPRTREIPIILLSARAGEESVIEGLEAGADDYLIKPFSAQELVSRVNSHLQMAQLRGEALHQERTLNRKKDELLSTVSHELNTPLVAILGWTRLLRTNPSNQSMLLKALETIERNATLQAKLIQDLLDMSRINAGKLRLKLEPVELESAIENAIASVSHLAQAKEIDVIGWGVQRQQSNTQTQQTVDSVVVMGDRDRLQQIIYNLLTNAIKFTPNKGSINVGLSVIEGQNSYDASTAEISITDTGIGISSEFLPHVFDRFRQAEESSSSKGLGLGLAIARHLVELHGGTIQAESAGVDRGATFTINLPLLQESTH